MLSLDDIARTVGKSKWAVSKKPFLEEYFVKEQSSGGRPRKFYSDDVLIRFGIKPANLSIPDPDVSESIKPVYINPEPRKRREDRGSNRLISDALEADIVQTIFNLYVGQARKFDVLRCVRDGVNICWSRIQSGLKKPMSPEEFAQALYKRLTRKDGRYVGAIHSQNWYKLWESQHSINRTNTLTPMNRWELMPLFVDAGVAGSGYGAGKLWVVDGTQADVWIDDNGKAQTKSYLMIADGLTGMPLFQALLEKGEKIEDVARMFDKAVQIHGRPEFGVVMDNGAAFSSSEIRNMVASWYAPGELESMATNGFRLQLFDGQIDPCIYPVARVPRFPVKANIERMFDEVNRYWSEEMPLSYVGSRDSRATSHELGSTPTRGVAERADCNVAFNGFVHWIYTTYINRYQPARLAWLAKNAWLEPRTINAWRYFGGCFELPEVAAIAGTNSIQLTKDCTPEYHTQIVAHNDYDFPAQSEWFTAFAVLKHHKVKAQLGYCSVRHEGEDYNLHCDGLDLSIHGKNITAVIDSERNKAYLFLEHDPKHADDRTPGKYDVYYIGEATNHVIDSLDALARKNEPAKLRREILKNLDDEVDRLAGRKVKIQNNVPNYKQLHAEAQYADYIEIEEKTADPELSETAESINDLLDF